MWTDQAHIPGPVLQFSTRLIPLQSRPSQLFHRCRPSQLFHRCRLSQLSQLFHRRHPSQLLHQPRSSQLFHRCHLSQLFRPNCVSPMFRNFQTPAFPSYLIPLMSPIPPLCLGRTLPH